MGATVTTANNEEKTWGGGNEPLAASYGKLMMWFFIVSDALTFSGFLAAYGFSRFKFIDTWPLADEVFTHFPFMHGVSAPMYYVALMTFILIFSSVTMVLAVDAGHHLNKAKVAFYMFLTIIGGLIFVGSQAWEWKNFIHGEYGAIETKGGSVIQFVDKDEKVKNPFQTSWGVSTRLIGGLIMMHSDDKGLVLPPKIAPIQIVIVPIANTKDDKAFIEAIKIKDILSQNFSVKLDDRVDLRPGEKYYEWEKKGVPIRIDIGPKDIEKKQCILTRRDTGEKEICELDNIEEYTKKLLDKIQYNLYNLALERREKTNTKADNWEEFKTKIQNGGYVFAHFCGDKECEKKMKDEIKVVSRCLPFETEAEDGEHYCIHCGKKSPTNKRWVFAKSY